MRHAGGRPTVLTEDVLAATAELRALGHGYGKIAQIVGVGRSTVARVLTMPRDGLPSQNSHVDAEREKT